jgi:FAD/FMN-containing dehydrogenase
MHGAVCRVSPESTAFSLRAAGAVHVWISAAWDSPSAGASYMFWADETWKRLQPFSGGRMYSNYQSVESEAATQAVFGRNHARLASLKKKYDPANVLRRNQNIRPAVS